MYTFREITYLILDFIKSESDDSDITEEHVLAVINKNRSFLLKQKYSDIKKQIPYNNYQSLCLNLIPGTSTLCSSFTYLISDKEVPDIINIGNPMVTPNDFYKGDIAFISRERMRYIGYNKYLKNIIYCSINPDNHLYLTSYNPQFKYLEKVKFTAVFQDAIKASELDCKYVEDVLDRIIPMEDSLIVPLIEMSVKELIGVAWRPKDNINNANDDLSDLATFISKALKKDVQNQFLQ